MLDPPAFVKSRRNLEAAASGYREINLRALRLLAPGGILVTCSCSHHLGKAMFLELIAEASLDAGRTVRVLERRTQAQGHPILLTVPETHYFTCLPERLRRWSGRSKSRLLRGSSAHRAPGTAARCHPPDRAS
jgi:23S rRNA (cytosine1962-C5)-methyltransferase